MICTASIFGIAIGIEAMETRSARPSSHDTSIQQIRTINRLKGGGGIKKGMGYYMDLWIYMDGFNIIKE